MPRIPDIPGVRIPRSDMETWLKNQVATLCRLDHPERRVPFSLPTPLPPYPSDLGISSQISRKPAHQFHSKPPGRTRETRVRRITFHIPFVFLLMTFDILSVPSYWVCEKSDGVRVLFFLQTEPKAGSQAVYLVSGTGHLRFRLMMAREPRVDRQAQRVLRSHRFLVSPSRQADGFAQGYHIGRRARHRRRSPDQSGTSFTTHVASLPPSPPTYP